MTPADWGLFLYCTMLFIFTWWEINQLLQGAIDSSDEDQLASGDPEWDNHFHVERIDPPKKDKQDKDKKPQRIEVDPNGVIEQIETPDGKLYNIVVVPADQWTKELRDQIDCNLYEEDNADDGKRD